jgi:hypothetical protein
MSRLLGDDVESLLAAANPAPSPLLDEMTDHGEDRGFPTVGRRCCRRLFMGNA